MNELVGKKCKPCGKETVPFSPEEAERYRAKLPDWRLGAEARNLSREYVMKDFLAATSFIQAIARVAESEDHHPDLHLTGYRKLRIELATHAIGGLSENDFILAAKIDALPKTLKK